MSHSRELFTSTKFMLDHSRYAFRVDSLVPFSRVRSFATFVAVCHVEDQFLQTSLHIVKLPSHVPRNSRTPRIMCHPSFSLSLSHCHESNEIANNASIKNSLNYVYIYTRARAHTHTSSRVRVFRWKCLRAFDNLTRVIRHFFTGYRKLISAVEKFTNVLSHIHIHIQLLIEYNTRLVFIFLESFRFVHYAARHICIHPLPWIGEERELSCPSVNLIIYSSNYTHRWTDDRCIRMFQYCCVSCRWFVSIFLGRVKIVWNFMV